MSMTNFTDRIEVITRILEDTSKPGMTVGLVDGRRGLPRTSSSGGGVCRHNPP